MFDLGYEFRVFSSERVVAARQTAHCGFTVPIAIAPLIFVLLVVSLLPQKRHNWSKNPYDGLGRLGNSTVKTFN